MKTSIDDLGRIVLPPTVQTQLGVKPGDAIALQEENGQWFLRPVAASIAFHDDELDWEELDYDPVPPRRTGKVVVRVEQRGKLRPMAYDQDDE